MKKRNLKRGRKDDPLFVGIITTEQLRLMEKQSRREVAIELGEYSNRGAGSGAHGGDKKQRRKKERQSARRNAKRSLNSGEE